MVCAVEGALGGVLSGPQKAFIALPQNEVILHTSYFITLF